MVDIITHQCELGGSRNTLKKRENFSDWDRNEKNWAIERGIREIRWIKNERIQINQRKEKVSL